MAETVESVIFDWGGTLTPWYTVDPLSTWLEAARAAVGDEDVERIGVALADAEEAVWSRALAEHRSGTIAEIFQAAAVTMTPALLAAYEEQWEPYTYIDPDAPPMLAALRERGVRVGVLSNTHWTREHHERVFARDGILHLLDGAVYTSEIPWTKPHPEAFRAAMAAVGVTDPPRCVFVGDRLFDDVWGAKSVGMRAVHLPHSVIPTTQRGHSEGVPDAVVQRLAEVVPLVDAWRAAAEGRDPAAPSRSAGATHG